MATPLERAQAHLIEMVASLDQWLDDMSGSTAEAYAILHRAVSGFEAGADDLIISESERVRRFLVPRPAESERDAALQRFLIHAADAALKLSGYQRGRSRPSAGKVIDILRDRFTGLQVMAERQPLLYRGVALRADGAEAQQVFFMLVEHDVDGLVQWCSRHLASNPRGGVGTHWTSQQDIAERFGVGVMGNEQHVDFGVVLEGRPHPGTIDESETIWDDYLMRAGEHEVPLRVGGGIDLTGIHVPLVAPPVDGELEDVEGRAYASLSLSVQAMVDDEGWWYHTSDGSPMDYADPSKGWVHLGTYSAADARRNIWRDRGMYRVRIAPRNPANSPSNPAEDQDANRINEWIGWGSPRDENGEPYVPKDVLSNSYDHVRLADAFRNTGFVPGRHDAIYYRNFMEDKGSISVIVPTTAMTQVELVNQQMKLFAGRKRTLYRGMTIFSWLGGINEADGLDGDSLLTLIEVGSPAIYEPFTNPDFVERYGDTHYVDYEGTGPGAGIHWTDRREVAERFALKGLDFEMQDYGERPVRVVMEISFDFSERQVPQFQHSYEPPFGGGGHEYEVTIGPGEPIEVTSLRVWRDGRWVETLSSPRRITAKKTATTPLADQRYGTPAKIVGDFRGSKMVVQYDRTSDTLYVTDWSDKAHPFAVDQTGGIYDFKNSLDPNDYDVKFIDSSLWMGAGLVLHDGLISLYGGAGMGTGSFNWMNPLVTEALARLIDTEPRFGSWMISDTPAAWNSTGRGFMARDWVARFNDIRSAIAVRGEYLGLSDEVWAFLSDLVEELDTVSHERACWEASSALSQRFGWEQESGYFVGHGEREGHYWVRTPSGTIVDAAYDQFDEDAFDPVLVVPPGDPRQAWYEREGMGRQANSFRYLDLYHGTSGYYAERILREGLKPRDTSGVGAGGWSGEHLMSQGNLVYLGSPNNMATPRSAMGAAKAAAINDLFGERIEAISGRAIERDYFESSIDIGLRLVEKVAEGERPTGNYGDLDVEGAKALLAEYEQAKAKGWFDGVLLQVNVPREAWRNFRADEDSHPYSKPAADVTGMPEWMFSLGGRSVVAYEGLIPASWIREAARGNDAYRAGMSGESQVWRMLGSLSTQAASVADDPTRRLHRGFDVYFDDETSVKAWDIAHMIRQGNDEGIVLACVQVANEHQGAGSYGGRGSSTFGVHWTTDERTALDFRGDHWQGTINGITLPVMVTADVDASGVLGEEGVSDTSELWWDYGTRGGEHEVSLQPGTPITLHRARIKVPEKGFRFDDQRANGWHHGEREINMLVRTQTVAKTAGQWDEIISRADEIAAEHQSGGQLGVCGRVSAEIARELGLGREEGFYRGAGSFAIHAWNVLPNGDVLDATHNQWGGQQRVVVIPEHEAADIYVAFTPDQQAWREHYRQENYGRDPDNMDWAFYTPDWREELEDDDWDFEASLQSEALNALDDQRAWELTNALIDLYRDQWGTLTTEEEANYLVQRLAPPDRAVKVHFDNSVNGAHVAWFPPHPVEMRLGPGDGRHMIAFLHEVAHLVAGYSGGPKHDESWARAFQRLLERHGPQSTADMWGVFWMHKSLDFYYATTEDHSHTFREIIPQAGEWDDYGFVYQTRREAVADAFERYNHEWHEGISDKARVYKVRAVGPVEVEWHHSRGHYLVCRDGWRMIKFEGTTTQPMMTMASKTAIASPATVYRGVQLIAKAPSIGGVPTYQNMALAFVEGQTTPDRFAQVVLHEVGKGNPRGMGVMMTKGLGVHWTYDLDTAKRFGGHSEVVVSMTPEGARAFREAEDEETRQRLLDRNRSVYFGAILEGSVPLGTPDPTETDPAMLWGMYTPYGLTHGNGEKEMPLRPGTPIEVTAVWVLQPTMSVEQLVERAVAKADRRGWGGEYKARVFDGSAQWVRVPVSPKTFEASKTAATDLDRLSRLTYALHQQMHPGALRSLHAWTDDTDEGFQWPTFYLAEMSEHRDDLQRVLAEAGVPERVTLRRVGEPRGPITNASLLERWGTGPGDWSVLGGGDIYEVVVPRDAIVGVGVAAEGEVFVDLSRASVAKVGMASDAWQSIPGLEFEVHRSGHRLDAKSPEASSKKQSAGMISWYPGGEVQMVAVWHGYRRMGLATELWRRAKEIEPNLHHSTHLTDPGREWSMVTAVTTTVNADLPAPHPTERVIVEAREGGELVGVLTVHLKFDHTAPDYQVATVWEIRVDVEHQRRGIATQMVEAFHERYPKVPLVWQGFVSQQGVDFADQMISSDPHRNRLGAKTAARTYYHVSEKEFPPGTVLTPGNVRGEQHIFGEGGSNEYVFMADSIEDAWLWIGLLVGPESQVFHTYEVEPLGPVGQSSAAFTGDIEWEYHTPEARVVRRVATETINPEDHGFFAKVTVSA